MSTKDFVKNTLSSDSNYTINKKIADELGWMPAIVLMDLIDECNKYDSKILEKNKDKFNYSIAEMQKKTQIKRRGQENALRTLRNHKFIEQGKEPIKGGPEERRVFKINWEEICDYLSGSDDALSN
jgi:hypothetical protein